jgi:predicted phosphodiesterase
LLRTAGLFGTSLVLPGHVQASLHRLEKTIKIGLIADLHHDIMHDAPQRLAVFLKAMEAEKPDAIMQLGDFAYPNDKNRSVTEAFGQAHPRALHVLGNHEIDDGHSFQEVARLWNMRGRYYTETIDGLHLVVLDGNEKPPNHQSGYPAHIGPSQLDWLRSQLKGLDGPAIVFCHQPLAGPSSIDNAEQVQQVLSSAADKILLTVNGHTHIDHLVRVGKLINLHINSASYYWIGASHQHKSYADEIHAAHPYIQYTCPYQQPLFATLMIEPASGRIHVKGSESHWVGQSPAELGLEPPADLAVGEQICPRIRTRRLLVG